MITSGPERLGQIEPTLLDGEPWWPFRAVANAMRIHAPKVPPCVPYDCRRQLYIYHPGYRSTRPAYINRKGVEALVLRYGGSISRAEWMAALQPQA